MKAVFMLSSLLIVLALPGMSTARALEPEVADLESPEIQTPVDPPATAEPAPETATPQPATPQPATPETATPEPATPEPATPQPATPETATPETEQAPAPTRARPPRYQHPRLMIAGGPILGPHAIGNEQCDTQLARCETKGSFLGMGAQLELRARLWRMIYAHARGLAVGNISPNDRIHTGLWGLGGGLGLYGRRAFGRAEYLFVDAFGDNRFEPPFYDGEVASDEWGHHAGLVSVGFRQPLPRGLAVELWGGLMIGPSSVRRIPQQQPDERVLTTFIAGINVSWDVLP